MEGCGNRWWAGAESKLRRTPYGNGWPLILAWSNERTFMTIGTILLVILILLVIGAIPVWPHSRSWGYAPGGTVGTLLIIVLILVLLGYL